MKYSQISILALMLLVLALLFSGCGLLTATTPAPLTPGAKASVTATPTPTLTPTTALTATPLPTPPTALGQTGVLGRGFAGLPVFSPDRKLFALPSADQVILFDAATREEKFSLDGGQESVQFSEDNHYLIANDFKNLTVFDLGQQKQVFKARPGSPNSTRHVAIHTALGLIAASVTDCSMRDYCNSHWMVWRLGNPEPLYTVDSDVDTRLDIRGLGFSPDGQWLAVAEANGQRVMVVEAATGKVRWNLRGHQGISLGVQFSPDGKTLVSGGNDGTVVLWSLATGQVQAVYKGFRDNIAAVKFSQDGRQVTAQMPDGSSIAIDLQTGGQTALPALAEDDALDDFLANQGYVSDNSPLVYSQDGSLLVTQSSGQHVRLQIWNVATRKLQALVRFSGPSQIAASALSPDGRMGASLMADGQWAVWDPRSGAILQQATLGSAKGSFAKALAFSADGKLLAFAQGQSLELWEISAKRQAWRQATEIASPMIVAFSSDGRQLSVVEAGAKRVEVHEPQTGQLLGRSQPEGFDSDYRSVALQGNLLAAKAQDSSSDVATSALQIFDLNSQRPLQTLTGIGDYYTRSIAISPDQSLVAVTDGYGRSQIWGLKNGQLLYAFQKDEMPAPSTSAGKMMAFSPDGQALVMNDTQGKIIFWDVRTLLGYEKSRLGMKGQLPTATPHANLPAKPTAIPEPGPVLTHLTPPATQPQAIAPDNLKQLTRVASWGSGTAVQGSWSLDGRSFTVVGSKGMFRYDLNGKSIQRVLTDEPLAQIVSGANGVFAVSSPRPALDVLDGQGKILQTLQEPAGKLVAISPDGQRALIDDPKNSALQVWDLQKNRLVSRLAGYYSSHQAAAFQPGSKIVAGVHDYSYIRLWEAESGQVVGTFGPMETSPAAIDFSPDGRLLAVVTFYGQLNVWDIASHKLLNDLAVLKQPKDSDPTNGVSSLVFGADARSLMVGSSEGQLYWVDLKANKAIETHVSNAELTQLKVSPGGGKLLVLDAQAGIQVWNTQSKRLESLVDQHLADFNGLNFQQDGQLAAWGGNTLWQINQTSDPIERVINVGAGMLASVSQNGAQMAVIDRSKAQLWDVKSASLQETLPLTPPGIYQFHQFIQGFFNASFSPDGQMLAVVGAGNTWVWDFKTRAIVKEVEMDFAQDANVSWRSDSQLLAFAQPGAWGLSIANPAVDGWIFLPGTDWPPSQFVFHPNGLDYAAVARQRDSVSNQTFYNIALGRLPDAGLKSKLILIDTEFSSLAYSPDGRMLAAGTSDGRIVFWDTATNLELAQIQAHQAAVTRLAYSPDGSALASAGKDGQVNLWRAKKVICRAEFTTFRKNIRIIHIYGSTFGGTQTELYPMRR